MKAFFKNQRVCCCFSLLGFVLLLIFLLSCGGSSDTRSQARSSTSGTYELNVQITTPVDGAIVAFVAGTADAEFTGTFTGGTEPVGLTWLVQGPTTENTSTGETGTITFQELGPHTITLTGTDSRGITDSDAVSITVTEGTGLTTTTVTTTTTTTTTL